MTVTGTGGASSWDGEFDFGIYVLGGSMITASGTGDVSVTGVGGSSVTGYGNYGVCLYGATITSGGTGTVTVSGTGGAGGADVYNNLGIDLDRELDDHVVGRCGERDRRRRHRG